MAYNNRVPLQRLILDALVPHRDADPEDQRKIVDELVSNNVRVVRVPSPETFEDRFRTGRIHVLLPALAGAEVQRGGCEVADHYRGPAVRGDAHELVTRRVPTGVFERDLVGHDVSPRPPTPPVSARPTTLPASGRPTTLPASGRKPTRS